MPQSLTPARRLTGNDAPYNPTGNRVPEDFSVIRIIACRICWLTLDRKWTNQPHERGLWLKREQAFELAQMCRGLLVIGSGLVDLDDMHAA